jgi:hypothetical protein
VPKSESQEVSLPAVVTFTSGAELLVELGIVESMTREGVRKIAKTDPDWPFGEGRAHNYGKVANAQTMATGPFLDYFRTRTIKKRGPDKEPRRHRPKPAE